MLTGAGREEKTGTPKSISASGSGAGGGGGGGGATLGNGGGIEFDAATGGGGGGAAISAVPIITPARFNADFTIEISGSGGTNGFFSTPSAPTRCASCSSRGSNAPTSKITGICESAESSLTYRHTSYPLRTGINTSAKTRSGRISEILRTAASP